MKLRGLVFFVTVALLLAACTTAAPTISTAEPAASTPESQTPEGYPYPLPVATSPIQPAYPAATVEVKVETGQLYPALPNGAEVTWVQASSMVMNQEVSKVVQTHDKKVYLTLKDGRTIFTTEAEIDAIMQLIKQCGQPCSTITIATE